MPDDALAAPRRARVRLSTQSGRVTVIGEARADIVVLQRGREEVTPATDEQEVVTTSSSSSIEVRCPVGTDVLVGSASGRVVLAGELGAARVTTASGSIDVEVVASADLRTHSAHVVVQECHGACRVVNRSGRIEIGRAAEVWVQGVSGTVDVGGDDVHVRTVSGRVRVATSADAAVETVSGKIEVQVPEGMRPRVAAQGRGRVRVEVPEGDDGELSFRTVSGSVRVRSG